MVVSASHDKLLSMTHTQAARWTVRLLEGLLLVAVLAYPLDWTVWRLRVAAGGGMGQVDVTSLTAAELKGNKEEYYPEGQTTVSCSRSLFRQAGSGACWYLRRHADVVTRY